MAAADKLWLELGVRDEISDVLKNLMIGAEKLADALSDDSAELKNIYRNIMDVANVYDKIYIAQKRISSLKGVSLSAEEKKGLRDMTKDLEKIRKQFEQILNDPNRLMESGEAHFDKMRTNVDLMVKSTLRYVDNIEAKEAAEAKNAANEERRIDSLKDKLYELQRYRKQLSDAIANAAPGTNLADATSLINGLSSRISAVRSAERNGKGLPASASGADYEEFIKRVTGEVRSLTSATNDYDKTLKENERLQRSINKIYLDTQSEKNIAGIRRQTNEYTALGKKLGELAKLMAELKKEESGIKKGLITEPTYTSDKISERLNEIDRTYKEDLAIVRQMEKDDADAKNKKAAAARRASDAIQALSHMNSNLISSYNRVAEAGSRANNITIQLQHQLAGYAGLYGIERILKSVITIGGQFEFQHVALQNILGDMQQANTLFRQLQDMAVESPKTFMELTGYTKQLSAYQIPYEELYDTTKRLADISTGLGVDMSRLILAYGQVRSAAVLRGQELRQFTEAGIPLVQKLAEKFTQLNGKVVTTGEVFSLISKRAVPFKMVKEILWDMTNEGGQFADMQSKLADTLYGKYQKLQDTWQIMLGRIADGNGMMGKFLKGSIEGVVQLVNVLNTVAPLILAPFIGKGIDSAKKGAKGLIGNITGETAVRNMEIAKLKQANALEKERILNGRQLTQIEQDIVRQKNVLTSNELRLLLLEDQITERQLAQMANSGKINKFAAARLLLEQGYTKEQIRQIQLGKYEILKGDSFIKKSAKGVWNFMGGWIGAGMLALGAYASLAQRVDEQVERARQTSEAASNDMLSDFRQVNDLYNEVSKKGPGSTDEMTSSIQRMTFALKQSGSYTKELNEMLEGTDDIREKYTLLYQELQKVSDEYLRMKENVQAYLEAANRVGEGNWFTKFFNDNMNEDIKNWGDANIAKNVAKKGVDRYSAAVKLQLELFYKNIGKWNEKEMADLDWQSLFDKLSDQERTFFKNFLDAGRKSDFDTAVYESVKKYTSAIDKLKEQEEEVDSQMQEYADTIEVALGETLSKRGLDLKDMPKWEDEDLKKFRDAINDVVNSYDLDSETKQRFKDKLYGKLLDENLIIRIKALPEYKEEELSEWQRGVNEYFESNKINIVVDAQSSLESVEKELQNKHEEFQNQMDRSGKILVSFGFDLSNLPNDIEEGIGMLRPEYQGLVRHAFAEFIEGKTGTEKTTQAGKDLGISVVKKNKGSSSGGSKKDKKLDEIKEAYELYKKFFSELENARSIYGSDAMGWLKENGFSEVFGWKGITDLTNYGQTVRELTKDFKANTDERKKFVNSIDADIVTQKRKEETEATMEYVEELQKMMNIMSESYNTYKKWYELTGDENLAARIAGVAENTTYSTYLRDQMQKQLTKTKYAVSPEDVFGMKEAEVKKLFGEKSAIASYWKAWQDNEKVLKKEELDRYEEAIKSSKSYEDKIDDINRKLKEQIASVEKLARSDEERIRLTEHLTENAEKDISKIKWEQFKDQYNWGEVFGDLGNVPLRQLKKLVSAMRELSKTTSLSATEAKAFQEGMSKVVNQQAILDPLTGINSALSNYTAARKEIARLEGLREGVRRGYSQYTSQFKDEDALDKAIENVRKTMNTALSDLQKAIKALANNINTLGTALKNIGNSVGGPLGDVFNGIGSIFGGLGNSISAISNIDLNAQGISAIASKAGAVATVVSAMIDMNKQLSKLLPDSYDQYQKYAEKAREVNKLREAVDDYTVSVANAKVAESQWFAGNSLSKLQAEGEKAKDTLKSYYKELYEAQEAYQEKGAGISKAILPATIAAAVVAGLFTFGAGSALVVSIGTALASALGSAALGAAVTAAIAAGVGSAIGQIIQSAVSGITYKDGQVDARSNMKIQTQHSSFWRGEKTQNLEEWAREQLHAELFDDEGLVNLEAAEQILEKYGNKLVGDTEETLKRLVALRKEYDEFIRNIEEYVGEIGTSLSDNMTNAMWDWLTSGKDALDSFKEYANDTWKSIAQDIVKTFMKVTVLDKYSDTMKELFKAWSLGGMSDSDLVSAVSAIAGAITTDFQNALPVAQQLIEMVNRAFGSQGFDITGSDSGSSTGSSIKSITEGTADLLAGYINAIRADVGMNRIMIAQYYPQFMNAMTQGNIIADAQLAQLRMVVQNTGRNAGLVEQIYDLLHRVAPDGTKWNVR